MCLLVVCQSGAIPKKADLKRGACANPHGYGFAMIVGDKVVTYRTMSAKKAVNKFLSMREANPDGYAIWHARYATHGVKNEYNCHPFQVGSDSDSYLAHNGVLDTHIEKGDRRSDTRIFAEDTLPSLGGVTALDNDNIWIILEKWASGSKIAVITVNPQAKHQLYLINEHLGKWDDDGIWWSNTSYQEPKTYSYTSTYTGSYKPKYDTIYSKAEDDLLDNDWAWECPHCQVVVDWKKEYCEICTLCFDCGDTQPNCLCYNPQNMRTPDYHNYTLDY